MKGKRLFVSFQGAESGIAVWLNGTFLGYSEDTFTPSEFELTPYLKEGENKLAAQVFKWTSGSWCEDQDFFRFSGIYRDVYLYTIPEVHVSDLKVQTLLDDTFTKADLVIDTKMIGTGKVKITLLKDGTALQSTEGVLDGETQFVLKVDHPELWSAETPVLYDLLLEVTAEDGTVQELIPQRVGFRRFEMKDHIMMLNGKRVVFKGVNRHEFSSVSGRVVSREELIKDLTTMKQNNINAIRTCHYPDAVGIYDLCDEYGLYMIAECNMESHGTRDTDAVRSGDFSGVVPCDRPEWMDCMLDRVNSMYQRDKNHPAILIWSCGNESFGGKVIFEMSQLYRKMDPTRLVHYEGVNDDRRYNDTSDMESRMYTTVNEIREFLSKDRRKPYVCCEYAHAMGNSCGAMHKYTDLTDTEPRYQGGFIWDFVDQGLRDKSKITGNQIYAYGGDYGRFPMSDENFNNNGLVSPDRRPNPHAYEVKYFHQNIWSKLENKVKGTVSVFNENFFVPLNNVNLVYSIEVEGKSMANGLINLGKYNILPQTSKTIAIPGYAKIVADKKYRGKEKTLTLSYKLNSDSLLLSKDEEIAHQQFVISDYKFPVLNSSETAKVKAVDHAKYLVLSANGVDVTISKATGLVSYLDVDKTPMLVRGFDLTPDFWRACTDNDFGSHMPTLSAAWNKPSMELKNFTRKENGSVVAELYLKETESTLTLTYTLNNNGELTVEQDLKVNPDAENKPNLLRYGMELQMPMLCIG